MFLDESMKSKQMAKKLDLKIVRLALALEELYRPLTTPLRRYYKSLVMLSSKKLATIIRPSDPRKLL